MNRTSSLGSRGCSKKSLFRGAPALGSGKGSPFASTRGLKGWVRRFHNLRMSLMARLPAYSKLLEFLTQPHANGQRRTPQPAFVLNFLVRDFLRPVGEKLRELLSHLLPLATLDC